MWDERAGSLPLQISMPLEGAEMNVQWPTALEHLNADPRLSELAKAAGIELNRDGVLRSLVAYLGSLGSGESRFERFFYDADASALTDREVWGFRLFVHKAGCASCHLLDSRADPFTDGGFHVTGIGSKDGVTFSDPGRGRITGNVSDIGALKTPSLRGVSLRPFLMHDGSMTSLREVIAYYNGLEHTAPSRLDPRLHSLPLSDEEMEAIVAFLQTLTPANFEKAPSRDRVSVKPTFAEDNIEAVPWCGRFRPNSSVNGRRRRMEMTETAALKHVPDDDDGFTLSEILVVVAIMGLLIGLVAPAVMRNRGNAKVSIAQQSLERLKTVLNIYKLDVGSYPTTEQRAASAHRAANRRHSMEWAVSGERRSHTLGSLGAFLPLSEPVR
jgi:prepilin-type N-terminal cleavage/methylation domain-containing protein